MTEERERQIRGIVTRAYGDGLQNIALELLGEMDRLKQMILSLKHKPKALESDPGTSGALGQVLHD
jgi:hypothetical protein